MAILDVNQVVPQKKEMAASAQSPDREVVFKPHKGNQMNVK